MNLIRQSIHRPTAVMAVVIMAVLFGLVALQTIPIQLAPDVSRPVIRITTNWPGAAPAEVEREILNPQEEALKGLEGLESMEGAAQDGRARVTLEFSVYQDMDKALLLVANRLDRVNGYPDEADEPTLDTAGSEDNPIAWFRVVLTEDSQRSIHTYGKIAEDLIQERLERVPGVGGVNYMAAANRKCGSSWTPRAWRNSASRCRRSSTACERPTPRSAVAMSRRASAAISCAPRANSLR